MELLLQLLISLTGQIGPISDLLAKMNADGRTTLTPAEWATVDSSYTSGHDAAVAALAKAKAAGK